MFLVFYSSIKNGYTDLKEEQAKKKKRDEEDKKAQMEAQDDNRALAIRNRIRELVAENPDITNNAIARVKTDKKGQFLISELQAIYGRTLEIEDFRQVKELREMVMLAIIDQNKGAFEGL